jgi:hypothetical protein
MRAHNHADLANHSYFKQQVAAIATHSGYTDIPSPQSLRVLSLTRLTALTGITGGSVCSEEAAPIATGDLPCSSRQQCAALLSFAKSAVVLDS